MEGDGFGRTNDGERNVRDDRANEVMRREAPPVRAPDAEAGRGATGHQERGSDQPQ